jgi:transposase
VSGLDAGAEPDDQERLRRWSPAERATILAAAFAPGAVVADVARQFEVSTSLIYK